MSRTCWSSRTRLLESTTTRRAARRNSGAMAMPPTQHETPGLFQRKANQALNPSGFSSSSRHSHRGKPNRKSEKTLSEMERVIGFEPTTSCSTSYRYLILGNRIIDSRTVSHRLEGLLSLRSRGTDGRTTFERKRRLQRVERYESPRGGFVSNRIAADGHQALTGCTPATPASSTSS